MEKVPQSRFKGYQEEWLETQLSKITTRVNRKNEDLKSDRVLTISAQYGLIDQNDFFNRRIASNSIQGYFLMKNGEFAYNKSYSSEYPVGAVKRLKLYDLGVLSTLYILFSIEDESLAEWIEAFFESDKWHKEIIKRASEGARNHGLLNISPTDFFELPLSYPSTPEEQYKIAQFFSRLDTLIAAEDKKLAKLKNMKAASLEKMFPKAGKTTPQVRFKGFSGEWKKQKLREITQRVTRKNIKLESNLALTISAHQGLIAQEDFFNRRIASEQLQGYFLIKKGEFAYNKSYSSEYPVGAVKSLTEYEKGVLSTLYIVFSLDSNVDSYWFTSYFETSVWHSEILERASEGARNHGLLNISPDDFFDIPIHIPIDIEEQKRISGFFSRLDTLISAQEQKLDKLHSLKKSFLEKMFVSTK